MPKKKKSKKIKKDKQTIILTIVFVLLALLVIGLIIDFIIVKNRVDNEVKVDIAIPLLDKEKDASFTINLANYKKDDIKEYTFKIKNYHEKLNKKDINYNIVFASKISQMGEKNNSIEKKENINDNKDFVKHSYSNLVKITVTEKVNNSSDSKYCDKCECNKLMFVDGSIVEKWLECNQTDEVVSKSVKLARNHQVGTS